VGKFTLWPGKAALLAALLLGAPLFGLARARTPPTQEWTTLPQTLPQLWRQARPGKAS